MPGLHRFAAAGRDARETTRLPTASVGFSSLTQQRMLQLHSQDTASSGSAVPTHGLVSSCLTPPDRALCPERSAAAASAETLQEMNPLVQVSSGAGSVATPPEPSALEQYHVALVAGSSLAQLQRWDDACAAAGVPFFGAMSRGTAAFLFADLLEHSYTTEVSCERCVFGSRLPAHRTSAEPVGHKAVVTMSMSL